MAIFYCTGCKKKHEASYWKGYFVGDSKRITHICDKHYKPSSYPEFVPQRITEDRKAHWKDMLPPTRGGEPSREFIDAYPERSKKIFTPKEIRKAKNVWDK